MKKNDIAALILIASVSALVAWFAGSSLIGNSKQTTATIKTADAITTEVTAPDKRIFNANAINPTVERSIGKSANSLPFE